MRQENFTMDIKHYIGLILFVLLFQEDFFEKEIVPVQIEFCSFYFMVLY